MMRLSLLTFTLVSALSLTACASDSKGNLTQSNKSNNAYTPVTQPAPPKSLESYPETNLAARADVKAFIAKTSRENNLDAKWMTDILNHTTLQPKIVEAMNRPAEGVMNWGRYRPIFMTEKRINDGIKFYNQYEDAFARAEAVYGVDRFVIAAIIGVETGYGQNKGSWKVVDALSTLAFDYPRRADYFSKELANFFNILAENGGDPMSYKGSYAGAMGYPQFMPSSYLAYAVDFDGDGHRDLWNNPVDAIGSVGNYLMKSGWVRGGKIAEQVSVSPTNSAYQALKQTGRLTPPKETVAQLKQAGVITNADPSAKVTLFEFEVTSNPKVDEWWLGYQNFYAITRYNHSKLYALAVYQVSEAIKRGVR
ncbi:lytic murein transglycosylase B [Ignatzschineria ureiclastica]|nr:lytic murein transglycosylase B [Ignatzschineria ureiclastica]